MDPARDRPAVRRELRRPYLDRDRPARAGRPAAGGVALGLVPTPDGPAAVAGGRGKRTEGRPVRLRPPRDAGTMPGVRCDPGQGSSGVRAYVLLRPPGTCCATCNSVLTADRFACSCPAPGSAIRPGWRRS